jgi:hypothetical protein
MTEPAASRSEFANVKTPEDVITSAIQEKMDLEFNEKHLVTDWVLIARHLESDGSYSSFTWAPVSCDEIIARGLLSWALDGIHETFNGDDDEL